MNATKHSTPAALSATIQPPEKKRSTTTRFLPSDLADVALLDIKDVCAAVRMSASWWYDEVRAGRAPQPLRYGQRCTRWRSAEVRQYLIDRAAQPQAEIAALVTAKAKKASDAAQAKRAVTAVESTK